MVVLEHHSGPLAGVSGLALWVAALLLAIASAGLLYTLVEHPLKRRLQPAVR